MVQILRILYCIIGISEVACMPRHLMRVMLRAVESGRMLEESCRMQVRSLRYMVAWCRIMNRMARMGGVVGRRQHLVVQRVWLGSVVARVVCGLSASLVAVH